MQFNINLHINSLLYNLPDNDNNFDNGRKINICRSLITSDIVAGENENAEYNMHCWLKI